MNKTKRLAVDRGIHIRLRLLAIARGLSIQDTVEELLIRGLEDEDGFLKKELESKIGVKQE